MFCALLGQDSRLAFTGPMVLWFMLPTSKKFGRHIGLGLSVLRSVHLCVTLALGQEPLEIGS